MAGVPTNFQAISNVLANYNFVDIASGTGYIDFYAGDTVDTKQLSNFTYYANTEFDAANAAAGSGDTVIFDHDFDTTVNRPLDVRGVGIVNVPIRNIGVAGNVITYVICKLRKYSSGVETDIVSNTSTSKASLGGTTTAYWMLAVDLDVPLTHFKVGDIMRLTIELHASNADGSPRSVAYGHDPKNRSDLWDTTGAVPSQLLFLCPVRLNL
jgi:hypothetical protein